jgi:trk system potassium uptake protein
VGPVERRMIRRWYAPTRHTLVGWRSLSAPQLFVGSFLLLILIGTVGLRWLPGLYVEEPLGWVDALFTATSAVCVTGLIVVDTATYFTARGQAFLLVLIQLGGLGMISFTTLIILVLGRRLSLRQEVLYSRPAELTPHVDFRSLARDIVGFTFLIEAIGALLLYLFWLPRFGATGAIWPAVFHSVSAFCNAGFSIFSDSLVGFQASPLPLLVIMSLIVAGGLGFLTLEEIHLRWQSNRRNSAFRMSLHSRLALTVTAALLAGGWFGFVVLEWRVTLSEMPWWARAVNALFMSVTARTAGFNTVDYGEMAESSGFLTIILMAIGGSPGSMAGGLKTTTVALIGLLALSRLRGYEITNAWGRTVPTETVQRAVGLFVVGFAVLTFAIMVLVTIEGARHDAIDYSFLAYMFEAASAFNTVGLSMGVTSDTSTPSRWLLIVLMYVGRVGPLTFAAAIALARPTVSRHFRYAHEDVVVG